MSDVDPKVLEDESLAWVNRLLSGSVTQSEAEALRKWRARSAAHEAAFAEAVAFRRRVRAAAVRQDGPGLSAPSSPLSSRRRRSAASSSPAKRISRRALMGGALAASGAGLAVVGGLEAGRWLPRLARRPDYSTAVGQGRMIDVAAGVTLQMNTRTSVAREGGRPGAAVRLLAGEAAITAQQLGSRPFDVIAGAGRTRLADAAVDVRLQGDVVCVTCISGQVELVHPAGRLWLPANHQITYTDARMDPLRRVDAQQALAWRRGQLVFRDAPLSQVVEELNRYRPGRILLLGSALGRRPVYGVFQLHKMVQAVDQVEALTGARATHLPGGYVILS